LANLLLVEDEESLREALEEVLADAGHQVVSVATAEAAVAAMEESDETPPDMILTDIRLPGMNGLDLITRARNHKAWKDIPIICLSASIPPAMEEHVARQKDVVFMRKPFEIDAFLAAVGHALGH